MTTKVGKTTNGFFIVLGIVVCLLGAIGVVAIIHTDEDQNKQELFDQLIQEHTLIDSIGAKMENRNILLINKRVWKKLEKVTGSIYAGRADDFCRAVVINETEPVSSVSIILLQPGKHIFNFYPQLKEYNPNKLEDVKTFQITNQALKELKTILNKRAVLVSEIEAIGEYVYII